MRPHFLKTAVAAMVCYPFASQMVWAEAWNGSYAAEGQCYCVGIQPSSVGSRIVPTPIGGQAVSQVCQRIGDGPTLTRQSGLFNYPVYADPQCGNGPFTTAAADEQCVGSLDGQTEDSEHCEGVGPKWDLRSAFSRQGAPAAAQPVKGKSEGLLNKPIVTTSTVSVETGSDDIGTDKPVKTTVIRSASTANRDLSIVGDLKPFTGRKVTIGGQRYLQARDGLAANGGEPGSRIILDSLVFLLDDGTINPADLYRTSDNSTSAPGNADEKPVEPALKKGLPDRVERESGQQSSTDKARVETPAEKVAVEDKPSSFNVEQSRQQAEKLDAAKAQLAENARLKAQARLTEIERLKAKASKNTAEQTLTVTQETSKKQAESDAVQSAQLREQAEKKEQTARAQRQDKQALDARKIAEKKQADSVAEAAKQVKKTASNAGADENQASGSAAESPFFAALRLPAAARPSSRNFAYLEAMPVSYDIGGGGASFEASYSSQSRFQFMGRLGVAANYNELLVGGGYYLTPDTADRLTVVLLAGIEYGAFELTDDQLPDETVDFSDSGLFFGAATRFVINNRFELKAGVGYSTFFEGDAMLFGSGYYHVNHQLDLVTRFEVGDNDLLGIGVRFYY